jgi:hypothetical protein
MDVGAATAASTWSKYGSASSDQTNVGSDKSGSSDLLKTLKNAFPGLSVKIGELPADQKEQEKLAWAGKLAGLTVHPAAAERMQSDETFRDRVVAGIKADQEEYSANKVRNYQGQRVETVAHGTVVEKDGSINSWTLSKSETVVGKDDDKTGTTKKKSFLEAIQDNLKKQREQEKLSQERYDSAAQEAERMRAAGNSDDEIAAKLRDTYLESMAPRDNPSVGIEVTA